MELVSVLSVSSVAHNNVAGDIFPLPD